jgi:hypothetical protein
MVPPQSPPGADLELRIADVGRELGESLLAVLDGLPGARGAGPQQLAAALGVDKVLTHRVLKAARGGDPLATAYHAPGPEPMRRLLRQARRRGVDVARVDRAMAAVDAFDALVRGEVGDRGALASILAAFLPEARREFELRRKQTAFRAMSELLGAACDVSLNAAVLHPSRDGERIDVVWIMGSLGLRRLRPGGVVKFSTLRIEPGQHEPRQPRTLSGETGEGLAHLRLDQFCVAPPAPVDVRRAGEGVHYVLGDNGFGPDSVVDFALAEVNLAELPCTVPRGSGRRGWFSSSITTPARAMHFDVLLHDDIYPDSDAELLIYDAANDGMADVNDRSRDIDRLGLAERVEPLARGLGGLHATGVPRYVELIRHVMDQLAWDGGRFRGWRTRIEYPIYGTQVALAFRPPETNGEDE